MSLTSIITSLRSAISDAYTVLASKGATMPTNKNTDGLADVIAALSVSSGDSMFSDPSKLGQGTASTSSNCEAVIFHVSGKDQTITINSYNSSGSNSGTIKQYSTSYISMASSTTDVSSTPGSSSKTFKITGSNSGTTSLVIYGIAYASPGYHLKVADCVGGTYLCINPTT